MDHLFFYKNLRKVNKALRYSYQKMSVCFKDLIQSLRGEKESFWIETIFVLIKIMDYESVEVFSRTI
jgi:hypothetical protein